MAIDDIVINATAQQIEDMATRQISQEITEDSSAEELASAKAVYDVVKKAGTGGGAGGSLEPLIVTTSVVDGKATATSLEIESHMESGGTVWFYINGKKVPLSGLDNLGEAYFADYENDNYAILYTIDSEGYLSETRANLVTIYDIGDLDAALAEILDYAQSLTSGGEG